MSHLAGRNVLAPFFDRKCHLLIDAIDLAAQARDGNENAQRNDGDDERVFDQFGCPGVTPQEGKQSLQLANRYFHWHGCMMSELAAFRHDDLRFGFRIGNSQKRPGRVT